MIMSPHAPVTYHLRRALTAAQLSRCASVMVVCRSGAEERGSAGAPDAVATPQAFTRLCHALRAQLLAQRKIGRCRREEARAMQQPCVSMLRLGGVGVAGEEDGVQWWRERKAYRSAARVKRHMQNACSARRDGAAVQHVACVGEERRRALFYVHSSACRHATACTLPNQWRR